MKTRFKTLKEPQIRTMIKKKNFLNSQNYVLGKFEKKKLLSKYFAEYFLIKFYKIISNFFNYLGYFSIIGGFILFALVPIIGFPAMATAEDLVGPMLYSILSLIFLTYIFFSTKHIPYNLFIKNKFFKINSILGFLTRKNKFVLLKTIGSFFDNSHNKNGYSFFTNKIYFSNIFYIVFVPIFIISFFVFNFSFLDLGFRIILTILFIIFFDYFSLVSFILFPIILIIFLFILLPYLFDILFGGLSRKYYIYKLLPFSKLFKKFDIISKRYAKNNYYYIKLKK